MTVAGAPASSPPGVVGRGRSWRPTLLALAAVCVVAAAGTYLTAPRPGGRMDPGSTSPSGAHALVALLRGRGVEVAVAGSVADAENAVGPDTLLLIAQTQHLTDPVLLRRLAQTPADLLLVEPTSRVRAALAPGIARATGKPDGKPNCSLREANRAGPVQFGPTRIFHASDDRSVTSCYGGALVRYRDGRRTVTLLGSSEFMTNGGLVHVGNAALAMNLAGDRARLVWYAPQQPEGHASESHAAATIFDMIPGNVTWMVWQLWLTVILMALARGRRVGPLVAEELPVVVRASETVEGHGRLYRSRRARDRAAQALRTATLRRLLPRLGLGATAPEPAVATAVAQRGGVEAQWVRHALFGPPPGTDTDLVALARALDDLERQVARV